MQRLTLGVFLYCSPPYFFNQGLSLTPGLANCLNCLASELPGSSCLSPSPGTRITGSKLPGSLCLCFQVSRLQAHATRADFLYECSGAEVRCSHLNTSTLLSEPSSSPHKNNSSSACHQILLLTSAVSALTSDWISPDLGICELLYKSSQTEILEVAGSLCQTSS